VGNHYAVFDEPGNMCGTTGRDPPMRICLCPRDTTVKVGTRLAVSHFALKTETKVSSERQPTFNNYKQVNGKGGRVEELNANYFFI
jgi:hypothetical protein